MNEADRCSYRRPFTADFSECPGFQPIPFVPADAAGELLGQTWTCRNLAAGRGDRGRFYPICRLGDANARERWAALQGDRALRLRDLRRGMVAATETEVRDFMRIHREAPSPERTVELRGAADRLIRALREAVEARVEALAGVGMEASTAAAILAAMVRQWEGSREPITSLEATPDLIDRFPGARDLLAPGSDSAASS